MQIISGLDKVFLLVYGGIILLTGFFFFFFTGKWAVLIVFLVIEALYLKLATGPYRRRRGAVKTPFPEEWRRIIREWSDFYNRLADNGRRRFERDVALFLSQYTITRSSGGEVSLTTRLKISATVATMLHGRPDWEPPFRDGVVVYPGDRFNRHYQSGRGNIAGLATRNGPLLLTEGGIEGSFRDCHDGTNVVIHEMAHYFDFEDGSAEGVPMNRLHPEKVARWQALIHREWQRAFRGRSHLRSYAGTNEAEFFAVASESFFETPWKLQREMPELYTAMTGFYNLNPLDIFAPGSNPGTIQ